MLKLVLFSLVTIALCGAQTIHRPTPQDLRSEPERSLQGVPLVDLSSRTIPSAATDPDEERAASYDIPSLPPLLDTQTGVEHQSPIVKGRRPQDALPWNRSELVVTGRVQKARAYLSKSKSVVYSVYTVIPDQILKGSDLVSGHIEIERAGGLVKYPSGKLLMSGLQYRGLPREGYEYLFFLSSARNGKGLQILTAYEEGPQGVTSLDDDLGSESKKYEGKNLELVVSDAKLKDHRNEQKESK